MTLLVMSYIEVLGYATLVLLICLATFQGRGETAASETDVGSKVRQQVT